MANRSDDYDGAWIQGGTARIAARGGPGGGPIEFDDTPPELKEHMKREENKDTWSFRSENLARLYGDHYTPFAEARKTMGLGDAKGLRAGRPVLDVPVRDLSEIVRGEDLAQTPVPVRHLGAVMESPGKPVIGLGVVLLQTVAFRVTPDHIHLGGKVVLIREIA